jgi:hypothetical protein
MEIFMACYYLSQIKGRCAAEEILVANVSQEVDHSDAILINPLADILRRSDPHFLKQ